MPIERERTDTVVTGGPSPLGIVAGILAVVVLVVLLIWLFGGSLNFGGGGDAVTIDPPAINPPAVDPPPVTVTP